MWGDMSAELWVGMGAEVGGSEPAAQHAADTLVDVVDVRVTNGITMADHTRWFILRHDPPPAR